MTGAPRVGGDALGRWLGRVLVGGTALAIGMLVAGMALDALLPGREAASPRILDVLAAGGPDSIVAAGLLVLALVPSVELAVAAAAFRRRGEHRYLVSSLAVLGLLLVGLATAVVAATVVQG